MSQKQIFETTNQMEFSCDFMEISWDYHGILQFFFLAGAWDGSTGQS
jgi:hypothetical protein